MSVGSVSWRDNGLTPGPSTPANGDRAGRARERSAWRFKIRQSKTKHHIFSIENHGN